jgi:MFS family permease
MTTSTSSCEIGMRGMSKKLTLNPWFVCLSGALFFFYEFLQLNIFDGISQSIGQAFSLDPVHLGHLAAMYFYGNMLMVIPAGILLDRFSTKKIIVLAMILCTVATFFFARSSSFYVASICRFVEGLGAGFCFLSGFRLASRWFPSDRLAFVTGMVVTMAMLGGLVAQTPMALLSDAVGWRSAMNWVGVLGIVLALWIIVFVKDYPASHEKEEKEDGAHLQALGLWASLRLVFKNPQNWFAGFYTCLMNLPIFIIGALWGMMYLQSVHGLSHAQASYVTSMMFIGVIIGSPFFGWFSDRVHSRRMPMVLGALFSLVVIVIMLWVVPLPLWALVTLAFLLGFVTSAQVLSYPAVAELNPYELTASATSIISFIIMVSGFVCQPLFGWMLERHAGGEVAVYASGDFLFAMSVIPVAFVVSLALIRLMKSTGKEHKYSHLS